MKVKSISIAGVKNEVIRYSEETDDDSGAVIIYCVVKVPEADRLKMKEAIGDNKYFTVLPSAIRKSPLTMRLGSVVWSQHEGYIKRNIVLVENKFDLADIINTKALPFVDLIDLSLSNVQRELAKNISYINCLESILVRKGIVTETEIAKIKNAVEREHEQEYRRFSIVDDAEKYK